MEQIRYEKKGLISREKLQKLIAYYKLKKGGIFATLLSDIENKYSLKEKYSKGFINGSSYYLKNEGIIENSEEIILSTKGKSYMQLIKEYNPEELLRIFEMLSISNVCWLPISKSILCF